MTDNDFGYESDFGSDDNNGMAAAIIGGGIAAGSQAINSIIAAKYNKENAEAQRKWSEQMLSLQNAWNEKMWNASNEYNSPSAQVQRMRDAGLNPLYYGLDGSSANAMQSSQPLQYERASLPVFPNPVASGFDAAVKVAQVSNIQADTAKKNNENLTETQRRENMQADLENAKQELLNLRSSQNLTDKQIEQIDKSLSWVDRMNEAIINEKGSQAKLNDSQRRRINELLQGEKLLQAKSLEDFERRWAKIGAEIEKMAQETGILKRDLEDYALNHLDSGFLSTGVSFENFMRYVNEGLRSSYDAHSGVRGGNADHPQPRVIE